MEGTTRNCWNRVFSRATEHLVGNDGKTWGSLEASIFGVGECRLDLRIVIDLIQILPALAGVACPQPRN